MQFLDFLWQLLIDPNIVYLLLIAGLWSAAVAFVTPGTGLPESAAVLALSLALLGLARMPVSIVGLALILLSVILFLLELKWPSHGAFMISGGLTLGVGSLFLFRADVATAGVSLWLIASTVLGTAAFFSFALSKAWAVRNRPPFQNPDAVVGAQGEAKTDVFAKGSVQVGNELWTAQADELIPAGSKVQVVQRSGLRLKVVRVKTGQSA